MTESSEPIIPTLEQVESPTGHSKSGKARWAGRTDEEKKKHMSDAAKARWAKKRKQDAQEAAPTSSPTPRKARKKRGKFKKGSRYSQTYSKALDQAESDLAEAIHKMTEAANIYAMNKSLIPGLRDMVLALRNQQNPQPSTAQSNPFPDYGLADIMADAALPQVRPSIPPAVAQMPQIRPGGGGGALAIPLVPEMAQVQQENEDQFLNDPQNVITGGKGWS